MAFVKIKNLLKETMGLSAESIGDSSIERAINHRKDVLKISQADAYLSLLIEDEEELNELVEEVVVPETWFFRNLAPFEALAKCLPDARKKLITSPLRVLSLPCSTGEEPYSIAMALLKNGLKENEFQIDAQDISKRALRKARRAIYGKHSFRETSGIDTELYFRKTRSGQQLLPIVRDRVNFIQSNIIKNMIMPEPEYYDVIFCRNLLIYFDRKTQKETLEKLHYMLKPGGTLFVGHAETSEVEKKYFTKMNISKAFAYRKKKLGVNQLKSNGSEHTNQLLKIYENLVEITQKDAALSNKIKRLENDKRANNPKTNDVKEISIWNKVESLIEKGHLSDASTLCEKQLKKSPDDAQAYYFLALVSKMEGSAGAAELLLKKSVYLNPNHHKALSLFCLLAEQRGDEGLAESLRRREGRARKRSGTA
ncbi:MAG: methyltransferase domain-containing protein [Gammaproteobacteria bacterium]|nr:methyltransferase domain-containing protein [Gammaproteobacteria bacterium]